MAIEVKSIYSRQLSLLHLSFRLMHPNLRLFDAITTTLVRGSSRRKGGADLTGSMEFAKGREADVC